MLACEPFNIFIVHGYNCLRDALLLSITVTFLMLTSEPNLLQGTGAAYLTSASIPALSYQTAESQTTTLIV